MSHIPSWLCARPPRPVARVHEFATEALGECLGVIAQRKAEDRVVASVAIEAVDSVAEAQVAAEHSELM